MTSLAAVLLFVVQPAVAQAPEPIGDDYQAGSYGRVRYHDGGLTILRAATNVEADAQINAPIYPGDQVLTDYGQRAEVQLAAGTLVRQEMGSKLTFLALPDPYAEIQDNTVLQLAEGTIRINAILGDQEEFRIDTPSASIYLLGNGDYRVEVNVGGRTRVISRRGVAEVVGQGGSVLVRGGTLTDVDPSSLPRQPQPFNTFVSDAFDQWFDDREAAYRPRDRYARRGDERAYETLPQEIRPYYGELSNSGSWANTEDYGYVWYPDDIADDWRPYRDGYWDYGPGGYFWVSNERWGWAPYHYGRWNHHSRYGWVWAPGRIFGGAWVAWSWGSSYVGWCALNYWNQPVYWNSVYYGYYDPYAWNHVHYDNFHGHHYNHHYVDVHHVGNELNHATVVTRPPRVTPTKLAKSPDARTRAVKQANGDLGSQLPQVVQSSKNTVQTFKAQDRRPAAVTGKSPTARSGPSKTALPSFDRRLSSGTAAQSGSKLPASQTRPSSRKSFGAAPAESSGGAKTGDPRDIYKRFSMPRTTRKPATPSRSVRPASSSKRTPPKPSGSSAKPAPRQRSGSSGSGAKKPPPPKPKPKPKGSSRDKGGSVSMPSYPRAGSTIIGDDRNRARSSAPVRRSSTSKSSPPSQRPSAGTARSTSPRPRPSVSSSRAPASRRPSASSSRPPTSRKPTVSRSTPPPRRPSASSSRSKPPSRSSSRARSSSGRKSSSPNKSRSSSRGSSSSSRGKKKKG